MLRYIVRRLLELIPTTFGILVLTFVLFHVVGGSPALAVLGKNATKESIAAFNARYGYDKPLLVNTEKDASFFDSQFCNFVGNLAKGDFGVSTQYDEPVANILKRGVGPSLSLTVPILIGGTIIALSLALLCAAFRGGWLDRTVLVGSTVLMSVNYVVWVLAGQFFLAFKGGLFPIWGYESWVYLALPVIIGVVSGLGVDVRFFRTAILDEIYKSYVRTARAKGLSGATILVKHVLRNSLIPIVTYVSLAIPYLFTGSLLLESFFGIPGLGNVSLNAIHSADMAVVRAVVVLGALLYQGVNLITDLLYAFLDPRVRLESEGFLHNLKDVVVQCSTVALVLLVGWGFVKISPDWVFTGLKYGLIGLVVVAVGWCVCRSRRLLGGAASLVRRLGIGGRLCLVVIAAYFATTVFGEVQYRVAQARDVTPSYNVVHEDCRYLPPLSRRTVRMVDDKTSQPLNSSTSQLFLMGTDNLGRDVAQRLVQGSRIAFHVGIMTSLIAIPLGVVLGLLGGYFGGKVDSFVVWLCATVASMPGLLFILAISLIAGQGLLGIYLGIGLTTWVGVCRTIRAEVMKHRDRAYVQAARVLGYSHLRIMFRHILPNVAHIILIQFSIRFPGAVATEVFISFLGIGVQGEPSWGIMINNARLRLWQGIWWEMTFVTLAIFTLVLVFNHLADELRDLLDPALRNKS